MPRPPVPVITRDYCNSKYTRTDMSGVQDNGSFDISVNRGVNNTVSGAFVPGWREKIARREDATSNYDRKIYGLLSPPACSATSGGFVSWPPTPPYHTYRGSCLYSAWPKDPFLWVSDQEDSVVRDIALAKLKSKINRASTAVNVLVPLAELREFRGLYRGMAEHATFMVRRLLDIKRGDILRGPKWGAPKRAGDVWLSWSFGMRPMMNDAEKIAEAIASLLSSDPQGISVKGTHLKEWFGGSYTTGTTTGAFNGVTRYWHEIKHTLLYQYSAGVLLDVKAGNNYAALSHLGFSLSSLPSLAWELTAYSWLVDYFTTTGAYLEDVFSSSNTQTFYCCLSRKYRYEVSAHVIGESRQTPGSGYFNTRPLNVGFARHTHFTRTKLSNIPVRQWRFKTSDEIAKNAGNKLLNLVALLPRNTSSRN